MAIAKPIPTLSETQIARFWARVDKSGECWIWKGSITVRGYGQVYIDGGMFKPHRVAWTLTNRPILGGLPLDHLCRNHGCVNPSHLDAVPHKENVRRGESPTAANSAKSHCAQGHDYTPDNTKVNRWNRRRCMTCYANGLEKRKAQRLARGARPRRVRPQCAICGAFLSLVKDAEPLKVRCGKCGTEWTS